ncbi:MAG TPA: hypothetical protein VIP46_22135 [Pyrinomonadaceae bacterium]
MREFIGVKSLIGVNDTASIKQEALMFDRIAVPNYSVIAPMLRRGSCPAMADYYDDLDWLFEEGIIFEPGNISKDESVLAEEVLASEEYRNYSELMHEHASGMRRLADHIESLAGKSDEPVPVDITSFLLAPQYQVQCISLLLRKVKQVDAYPILPCYCHFIEGEHVKKKEVVQITLGTLPMPDYSTPWEQILEYRSDPDSKGKFWALRNWMSETAKAELSPFEVVEKLETLLYEYQKHLELHKLKTNVGKVEAAVITVGEFLEDLANRKFSKIAKGLFDAKQRQIALIEGELTAPGKEVSYVIEARGAFNETEGVAETTCEYCGGGEDRTYKTGQASERA